MNITIKYFGCITDITGNSEEVFELTNEKRISIVEEKLFEKFSKLKEQSYALFLNRCKVTDKNIELNQDDELCFMPPFSGG